MLGDRSLGPSLGDSSAWGVLRCGTHELHDSREGSSFAGSFDTGSEAKHYWSLVGPCFRCLDVRPQWTVRTVRTPPVSSRYGAWTVRRTCDRQLGPKRIRV